MFYYDQDKNYRAVNSETIFNHIINLPHCMLDTVVWYENHQLHYQHDDTKSIPVEYEIIDLIPLSKNTILVVHVDGLVIINKMVTKREYKIKVQDDFRVINYHDHQLIFYNSGYRFKAMLTYIIVSDVKYDFIYRHKSQEIKFQFNKCKFIDPKYTTLTGLYINGYILYYIKEYNVVFIFSLELKIATVINHKLLNDFSILTLNKKSLLIKLQNGTFIIKSLTNNNMQHLDYASLTKDL